MQETTIDDTGERMIPEFHHDALIYAEHVVRYLFASGLVRGRRVLDLGSGVGYGSDMLKSAGAAEVIGIDRSREAVSYGREHHASLQPDYLVGDAESIPVRDQQFDVVVSFETLEHVADHRRMLAEAKRVMRPGGLLIISTPNRGVYMEGNPFHTKEFTLAELEKELAERFEHVGIFAQDNWIMSAILSPATMERVDGPMGGALKMFKTAGRRAAQTLYLVTLCSDDPLPKVSQQVAVTDIAEMRQYVEQIDRLTADIHRLGGELSELNSMVAQRDAIVAERDALLAEKDETLAEKEVALADMDATLDRTRDDVDQREEALQQAISEIATIRQSSGYRMLEAYRRLVRWLFPLGSWRGLPYWGLRRAVGWLLRRGRRPPQIVQKAFKARRRYGTRALVRRSIGQLTGRPTQAIDPVSYALAVDWRSRPSPRGIFRQPLDIDRLSINWVVPTIGEGGGHLNIFRFVQFLSKRGHRQRVYEMPIGRPPRSSREELRDLIDRMYDLNISDVYLNFEGMLPADITVATSWHTAYPVVKFGETRKKCYLVQDFEPLFTPMGSESALAENTYRFGFHGITAGPWLAAKLRAEFGMECDHFNLAVDPNTYYPKEKPGRKSIFFYARPATPRRGFELGVKALEIFHERNPDYRIVFAGGDDSWGNLPFPVTNVGYVSFEMLNELYNDCAAALVVSLTNCSLLPIEIMATGCPVVTTAGENNETVLPSGTAVFAVPSPYELAQELEDVVRDPPPIDQLVQKAVRFRWEDEIAAVERVLKRLMQPEKVR